MYTFSLLDALEAWKIPEILKENNISVATFSDHWLV